MGIFPVWICTALVIVIIVVIIIVLFTAFVVKDVAAFFMFALAKFEQFLEKVHFD